MAGDQPRARHTKLGIGDLPARKPPHELLGNVVLERYRVSAELGAGAMGTVYRGTELASGAHVAIKVLHDHLGREPTMLGRFRREARAAARLRHPNVVGVIELGETDGRPVMVLEYAEGPSLGELMEFPLAAPVVTRIADQLLRGLQHAHEAGLIHRDLKPENVIVSRAPDGGDQPRIVDFGIAMLRDDEDTIASVKLTGSGMVIGTPAYMSPEQAKAESIDHRADLFALGVMMYEMLAGALPFDGSAPEVAIANMTKDPPMIVKRSGVAVPPLLERFVRRLMARRAFERFDTADDARLVLAQIERDPEAASLALGRTDTVKASALIGLPTAIVAHDDE